MMSATIYGWMAWIGLTSAGYFPLLGKIPLGRLGPVYMITDRAFNIPNRFAELVKG